MEYSVARWLSALLLAVTFTISARELPAQGYLIPDTTRRDMVFNSSGQYLYISTSTGRVKTFNLATLSFGSSYNLGGSLNGIDIARDNSFLLVAQNYVGISQGAFHRVNLATGIITNINYTRASYERGAWDVAIGSNGRALVTTQFGGSGWTPLREINLSTNAVRIRSDAPGAGYVTQDTQIHRSANGTRLFLMQSNHSSGPVFTYSATTNTFGPRSLWGTYLDGASGAVNRNGNLIAVRSYATGASLNTAPNFNFLHSLNGVDSGVAFDAVLDVVYGVNSATDQIVAYNTSTFAELFRLNIGEDLPPRAPQFGTGTLVTSANGRWIALETDLGIRLFQLPNALHPTDINRDGKPDYLLYNAGTRQMAVWYLNNNVFVGAAAAPTLPVGWRMIDVADFNRDGHPDYALFNASTRQTAIWYLSGVTHIGSASGPTPPDGWALVASGDFNNDGRTDYVLHNASTYQTAVWFLNNNVSIGGAAGPGIPASWSLVGVADFNGDYKPDYLLFNPTTGQTVIWYLSGTTRIGSTNGPTSPGGWSVVGVADFNKDYKPDYLLFKPTTSQTVIWYLNNNIRIASAVGPTLLGGWTVAAP